MLVFPNCKINIGLRITEKRPDGFHNIESVFYPVPWYDALEIIESNETRLFITGLEIPGNLSNNLCIRAWRLLKNDFSGLPPVDIYLHKSIPTGAGLGGGSANGAFMLKALNEKFSLGLSTNDLCSYAIQLGSDCPFFIINSPAFARQRGENLEPLQLPLNGLTLTMVNPGIHINTGWAFGRLKPNYPASPIESLVHLPIGQWAEAGIGNDFQNPVVNEYPEIASILEKLKRHGALFASMTGTGSTCYGFFKDSPSLFHEDFPPHYLVKKISL